MGEQAARLPPGLADDAQWYSDTFRTLSLDFHYPAWVTGLGAALDEQTALAQMEELAAIGVEAVHVVAKDRYGHALYPTNVHAGRAAPTPGRRLPGHNGAGGAAGETAGCGVLQRRRQRGTPRAAPGVADAPARRSGR